MDNWIQRPDSGNTFVIIIEDYIFIARPTRAAYELAPYCGRPCYSLLNNYVTINLCKTSLSKFLGTNIIIRNDVYPDNDNDKLLLSTATFLS